MRTARSRTEKLRVGPISMAVVDTEPEDPFARADSALARAVREPSPGQELSLEELSARTGMPIEALEALERERLLLPRRAGGELRFTPGDEEVVKAGVRLLQAGVPLDELLALARRHDEVMRGVADQAVELFIRFVRDPIQGTAASDQEAAERLVTAFRELLPAAGAMVGNHFRGLLLAEAQARIERDGRPDELAVLRREHG